MAILRYLGNPILTRAEIISTLPYLRDVSSVFNPAAIRLGKTIYLLLRVQNRGRETYLIPAESEDGVSFRVYETPLTLCGIPTLRSPIYHCYDPRLTVVHDELYMTVAMDVDHGCLSALFRVDKHFHEATFMGFITMEDTRNAVLFPELIQGNYCALIRPNTPSSAGNPTSGDSISLLQSKNFTDWKSVGDVIKGRWHYWDERIGAGPPPIKTKEGWLLIYHGIATHFASAHVYQAGVVLLDLDYPTKVLGRSKYNILEPRELYELTGQVPNVVFPSGWVVNRLDEEGFATEDSSFLLYYGAADTCVGLAMGAIGDLLDACKEGF